MYLKLCSNPLISSLSETCCLDYLNNLLAQPSISSQFAHNSENYILKCIFSHGTLILKTFKTSASSQYGVTKTRFVSHLKQLSVLTKIYEIIAFLR